MYHLAQANYGQWKPDITKELVQEYYNRADAIIQSAKENGGWVWSYNGGFFQDPRTLAVFEHPLSILNMNVWTTFEDLKRYVFDQVHGAVMYDKNRWFEKPTKVVSVMWWVKIGEVPTIAQAKQKIDLINQIGPSPEAFNFTTHFDWNSNLLSNEI